MTFKKKNILAKKPTFHYWQIFFLNNKTKVVFLDYCVTLQKWQLYSSKSKSTQSYNLATFCSISKNNLGDEIILITWSYQSRYINEIVSSSTIAIFRSEYSPSCSLFFYKTILFLIIIKQYNFWDDNLFHYNFFIENILKVKSYWIIKTGLLIFLLFV